MPRADELIRALLPPGAPHDHVRTLAQHLDDLIDQKVDARLASIGGQLLADHGEGKSDPNPILASVGGRLTGLG